MASAFKFDLAGLVDALPKDPATDAVAACQKTLTGPHVCSCCSLEASSFCMQCSVKLCTGCAKHHCPSHYVEKLSGLTAEKLAVHRRLICNLHSAVALEQYCTRHKGFVCVMCNHCHDSCKGMLKSIPDAAAVKRAEIRHQVKLLTARDPEFLDKINLVSKVHTRFTGRSTGLEIGEDQQRLKSKIDSVLIELQEFIFDAEDERSILTAARTYVEQQVTEASDAVLLGMVESMWMCLEECWQLLGPRQLLSQHDKVMEKAEKELDQLFEELTGPTLFSWIKPQLEKERRK